MKITLDLSKLVNFGFWVGSLWGDPWMLLRRLHGATNVSLRDAIIPASAFSIVWALVLIGAVIWGVQANRRWMVNIAAGFGAIHFYTQWFEKLGATPLSVLLGGLVMLGIALALRAFNRHGAEAKACAKESGAGISPQI